MAIDPIGLQRCAWCSNAFAFDAVLMFDDGFICGHCEDPFTEAFRAEEGSTPQLERAAARATEVRAELEET